MLNSGRMRGGFGCWNWDENSTVEAGNGTQGRSAAPKTAVEAIREPKKNGN